MLLINNFWSHKINKRTFNAFREKNGFKKSPRSHQGHQIINNVQCLQVVVRTTLKWKFLKSCSLIIDGIGPCEWPRLWWRQIGFTFCTILKLKHFAILLFWTFITFRKLNHFRHVSPFPYNSYCSPPLQNSLYKVEKLFNNCVLSFSLAPCWELPNIVSSFSMGFHVTLFIISNTIKMQSRGKFIILNWGWSRQS